MFEHRLLCVIFSSIPRYFLDGNCWSELCGSCPFSGSFLGYHIYHQCCFLSLAVLTRNNEQPLIPWSMILKSLRTRQMSISSSKPGSPTALWPKEFYPSNMKTEKADLHPCALYWETLSCQICSLRNTLCFHGSNGKPPRFFFQQATLRSQTLAVTFSPLPISIALNQQPLLSEAASRTPHHTQGASLDQKPLQLRLDSTKDNRSRMVPSTASDWDIIMEHRASTHSGHYTRLLLTHARGKYLLTHRGYPQSV